jgi:type IV secretion system protein VirD4
LALSLYAFDRKDYWADFGDTSMLQPSLAGIHRLAIGDGRPIADYLRQLRSDAFVRDDTRRALDGLLSQAGDTFASIIGSLLEPLNPWVDPQLAAATACNDFDLRDVRRRPMTIYVVIPPHRLAEARLLINVLFSQLINLNTRELPSKENGLNVPCLLLMDEFTAVGKIEILASAVAYMAGYNLRLLPIIQSVAQLDAVYGKEIARTLITNHAAQILFAPREQQDAKEYSEMLGDRSVSKATVNRGRDRSVSTSEERRPLMLPQELKAMGKSRCVLMIEGVAEPISARKIVYYRDPVFAQRLLPPVSVPKLAIGE